MSPRSYDRQPIQLAHDEDQVLLRKGCVRLQEKGLRALRIQHLTWGQNVSAPSVLGRVEHSRVGKGVSMQKGYKVTGGCVKDSEMIQQGQGIQVCHVTHELTIRLQTFLH